MSSKVLNTIVRQYTANTANKNTIVTEKIGKVLTIGINRPDKRNCVDSQTARLLTSAIEDFENDPSVYAGVLYGTGGNFCAGYDLKELSGMDDGVEIELNDSGTMQEPGIGGQIRASNLGESICWDTKIPLWLLEIPGSFLFRSSVLVFENSLTKVGITESLGPTLRYIKKPMVAAISGYAVAGGLELALMCDMRVMEDSAIMGVYCRRFGVPLIDGGTVRLQALVGLSRALDLILTGRSLTAKEAFEWGLANRLVACGTALGQAINLATSLVKFPQECLLADRQSTYNAAFNSAYTDLLNYEQQSRRVLASESIDGAKLFVSGIGRHGKSHNLTEKDVKDWEKEYDAKHKL